MSEDSRRHDLPRPRGCRRKRYRSAANCVDIKFGSQRWVGYSPLPTSSSAGKPMQTFRNDQPRSRIAVIDDDAIFVDLMHDLLATDEGYEVVSTEHWLQSV